MPLISYITKQYSFAILALTVFIFNNGAVDALGIKVVSYVGCVVYCFVPSMVVMTAAAPQITLRGATFFIKLLSKIRIVKDPVAARRGARSKIAEYSMSLKGIAKDRGIFPLLLALSLLMQLALNLLPFFVIRFFGGAIDPVRAVSMCVFVNSAVIIVPTPGNAGAAEGSFYYLFSQLEGSGLFFAMLVWRFFSYYLFIINGLAIYGVKAVEKVKRKNAERKSAKKNKTDNE